MKTAGKLSEHVDVDAGLINADITTDRQSGWVSMANFRRALGHLQTGSVDAGSSATLQFQQAQDSGGTGAKALGDAVSQTAGSGGEALEMEVEAFVSDMDTANGFTHIRMEVTCDNSSAVIGAATLVRDEGRF